MPGAEQFSATCPSNDVFRYRNSRHQFPSRLASQGAIRRSIHGDGGLENPSSDQRPASWTRLHGALTVALKVATASTGSPAHATAWPGQGDTSVVIDAPQTRLGRAVIAETNKLMPTSDSMSSHAPALRPFRRAARTCGRRDDVTPLRHGFYEKGGLGSYVLPDALAKAAGNKPAFPGVPNRTR